VQLSDTHITRRGQRVEDRVDTASALMRAIHAVRQLDPVPLAVLISGDLVESGAPEEYAHLRSLLAALPVPTYLMPGNHDDRAALRAAFPDHAYLATRGDPHEPIQYVVDLPGLRLVALDSTEPGASHGSLCPARLHWLSATLAQQPTTPTLLALHHPPYATHIPGMDALALRDGREAFIELVRAHPQVQRIVCGHLHRSTQAGIGNTVALSAPSTAHQVCLDLSGKHPPRYTLEPPGLLLHVWAISAPLVTHLLPLGNFPGPFDYRD
jgi:3',5'-cyclic AMP phosphodiesterase CpdA